MYKVLLILRYLRKRRIAWVSLLAVTMCTAMVLVVISVMGGWLRMFRQSFHGIDGDVIVMGTSGTGFPYYEEMAKEIEKLPEVGAGRAVPIIRFPGMIDIANEKIDGLQVLGYPMDKICNVNGFRQSLYWQYQEPLAEEARRLGVKELSESQKEQFLRTLPPPSFQLKDEEFYKPYNPDAPLKSFSGMIVGIGVAGIHKDHAGAWVGRSPILYQVGVSLTVPVVPPNDFSPADVHWESHNYFIVDDSRTGIYQVDTHTVYVPFDKLQRDLGMGEQHETENGRPVTVPARATQIDIAVRPGASLEGVKQKVQAICDGLLDQHRDTDDVAVRRVFKQRIQVQTWEESQAVYLNAIENEKLMVTFLFGVISLVAVFLIFCIFYMIVVEKTRDIGIIKSVGATNGGVAAIFLGYGLTIGLVGAGLGLLIAYLVVHNINALHAELARLLGVTLWDPQVYAFDTIPSTMNPPEVWVIMSVAVSASVLGALWPAVRAAWYHPVEALRWE